MKKLLILLYITSNIYANNLPDHNLSLQESWVKLKTAAQTIDTDKVIDNGVKYFENLNSPKNRDKAVPLYQKPLINFENVVSNISYPFIKFNVKKS